MYNIGSNSNMYFGVVWATKL